MEDSDPHACVGCQGCAARDRVIAERDRVISDQARVNERLSSELRWHGLDENALSVDAGIASFERARSGDKPWPKYKNLLAPLRRLLGSVPCLQVTPERWAEHRATRSREACGRWGAGRPSSTWLDQELRMASMLFRWLVRAGKLPRNPLELARCANEPAGRETYLEEPAVQRLIDGAGVLDDDPPTDVSKRRVLLFRAWVQAKFRGGLRFEEVRNVRRDRIGADGVVELSAKKTKGKKKRTVAFPPVVLAAFDALPALDGDPRVFTHRPDRGRAVGRVVLVSPMTLREWFGRVCKATGVDKLAAEDETVVPHVLRHSAASYAEEQGAHPLDIQDFLGHSSFATTEKYLHRRPAQRAVRMAAIMGGSRAASKG